MKSLIIAAAVAALALPAFAAENDKEAAQPQVEKTAPATQKATGSEESRERDSSRPKASRTKWPA